MIIGGVEFAPLWEKPVENANEIRKYFEIGKKKKVDLLVFPEMTLTGFTMNREIGDSFKSENLFRELSEEFKIAVVFGWIERKGTEYYNSATFFEGKYSCFTYHKRRLFSFGKENLYYSRGEKSIEYEFMDRSFSNLICYDLRFPELFRETLGTQIYIVIANWPESRKDHWKTLLKSRAIENQAFVFGINRSGKDPQISEYGNMSAGFDYLGRELTAKREVFLLWEISDTEFDEQLGWRKKFNVIDDNKR